MPDIIDIELKEALREAKILIVDDEEGIRQTTSAVLGRKGFETATASSGQEALEKFKSSFYNIALIDIKLPDMEGTALIAPLKEHSPDTAIIMITGSRSFKDVILSLNSGAEAYITKPMNMDEVLIQIGNTLERQFLMLENRRLFEKVQRELNERNKAEEALMKAHKELNDQMEILRAVINNIPVMLVFCDPDGKPTMMNAEFSKGMGWSAEETIQNQIFLQSVTASPSESRDNANILKAEWRDFSIPTRTNGMLESSWASVRLSDGSVIGIGIDITERKRSEETMQILLRRLVDAHEQERRRVARELHDSVNQILSSANIRIQMTKQKICDNDQDALEEIQKGLNLLKEAMKEIRRISHNLRPSILDDLGLLPAIRSLCTDFRSRTQINVDCLCTDLPIQLPPQVDLTLYRITQEAMNNIERHSNASKVQLNLEQENDCVVLTIRDNGKGFDPLTVAASRKNESNSGLGLIHIPERAAFVKGTASITSTPGQGTTVCISIPLGQDGKKVAAND